MNSNNYRWNENPTFESKSFFLDILGNIYVKIYRHNRVNSKWILDLPTFNKYNISLLSEFADDAKKEAIEVVKTILIEKCEIYKTIIDSLGVD